jgi:hypothetical protein
MNHFSDKVNLIWDIADIDHTMMINISRVEGFRLEGRCGTVFLFAEKH